MDDNGKKIILDLCGGTGAWSRPYKEAGYDVRVITLPEYDVTKVNLRNDELVLVIDKCGVWFPKIPYTNVYGILAAPPCTEFSLAKNGSHGDRNLSAGLEVVRACRNIIEMCRLRGNLKFWAMENPVGYLRQFIGKPGFTFYQWWFGDIGIKRTDLWGYFNPPRQTVFERPVDPYFVKQYKSGKKNQFAWATPKPPEWYDGPPLERAALRAVTPPGFAEAFYRANK